MTPLDIFFISRIMWSFSVNWFLQDSLKSHSLADYLSIFLVLLSLMLETVLLATGCILIINFPLLNSTQSKS